MKENFDKKIDKFIDSLKNFHMENVFNPWNDYDELHDIDEKSAKKRCENLKKYLLDRENTKYVLIAEAPGYQGCHFSGIPMTSERLILTPNNYGFENLKRTSDSNNLKNAKLKTGKKISQAVIKNGFTEPTATVVWQQMVDVLKFEPTDFVLWNAFPFHPYTSKSGILSNRKPSLKELENTKEVLEEFLKLFENKPIICIGNTSKDTLNDILKVKFKFKKVRHPAYGGANEFRSGIMSIKNS